MVIGVNRLFRADNTTKDTLYNIQNTREAVINVVNYDIVRQMTVTSIQYPAEISEFDKAGLTPIPSEVVRPFRVQESPAHLECQVQDMLTLGEPGGAGNLIISRVVRLHIAKPVVDERNRIAPQRSARSRNRRGLRCPPRKLSP